jgi:hypothetical protein
MTSSGFTIARIAVTGPGRQDADLNFRPGLNVVAGASNTGKTYVFQLIDFLLGGSRPPKNVPLSVGYSHAQIELMPRSGGILSLSRSLSGGGAASYSVPLDGISGDSLAVVLAADHEKGNVHTISGQLLTLTGLFGKEVRKNERGEKRSLSFRDVSWLALVDEERIITDKSPALSGQYTESTVERSAFGLFLSGVDDAAIVAQERPEQRKLRLETEILTYQRLLDEREKRLHAFGVEVDGLPERRERLDKSINEATALLATQQSELDAAAQARDAAWTEIEGVRTRRLFLSEQLKRLRLLRQHYASDTARLESAMEAGELFERLPTGQCPVCGHTPDPAEVHHEADERLKSFQAACAAELDKIRTLARDLDASVASIEAEDVGLDKRGQALSQTLGETNAAIKVLLDRKIREADVQLSGLLTTRTRLAEAGFVAAEVLDLRTLHEMAVQGLKAKAPRAKIAKKVQASGTVQFCQTVSDILRAWKFPFDGNVSWSDDRFDLVIGNENRGDLGKGFRAVTHAAFTIALMRYCRALGLPHPGIVVLDTPLNPFKGPDQDVSERVNEDVQEAFYSDLAADKSGDQVIILENTEPPRAIRDSKQYTHFSGNPATGRAGFFPLRPPEPQEGQPVVAPSE